MKNMSELRMREAQKAMRETRKIRLLEFITTYEQGVTVKDIVQWAKDNDIPQPVSPLLTALVMEGKINRSDATGTNIYTATF